MGQIVINGTFDTDVNNWSQQAGIVSWDAANKRLIITTSPGGSPGLAYQQLSLTPGNWFKYSAYHKGFAGRILIGSSIGGANYLNVNNIPDDTTVSGNIFISALPVYFTLSANSSTNGANRSYDNISLRPYGVKSTHSNLGLGLSLR